MSVFLRPCHALAALLALGTVAVAPAVAQISAVPNSINFQGRLATPSGNPVPDGTYSVRFSLHDALTAGTEKYNKTIANVNVKNGTFAVTFDAFPANTFNGNLWLEVKIGTDAALTPRTPLVTVPYAFKSDLALTVPDGSITAAKFASGVLNANVWLLGGNSGVTSNQFLGTTDNNPLELRVNNHRAMRYEYAEDTGFQYRSVNVLGGSETNSISAGVIGATIAGGGMNEFTGEDFPNRVTNNFGTIGGGAKNTVNGSASTVGGGSYNTASGSYSTVGGGIFNTANGYSSTVGGGRYNTADGLASTVAGGYNNSASGSYSFAAGRSAKAVGDGVFVWSDSTDATFVSTAANQFLIRANGGVGINTNAPQAGTLHIKGNASVFNLEGTDHAYIQFYPRGTSSGRKAYLGFPNAGSRDLVIANEDTGVLKVVGTFVNASDARYKYNVAPLNNALDAILGLRGVSYQWRQDKADVPRTDRTQLGFIAQQVETVLPDLVYTDSKGYKSVNYIGVVPVLVEAVKTQNKKVETLSKENAELKARLDAIERALAELKANPK